MGATNNVYLRLQEKISVCNISDLDRALEEEEGEGFQG